ncbi:hypothetical protein [Streptomyces sp. f150]|uniref:hypothetical protein n=1 Tax=Streptomyces sp. f150 TaxID=1827699 RepID=UPI000BEFD89D
MIKNLVRGFGALSLALVSLLSAPATHAASPVAEVTTLADAVGLVPVTEEDRTGRRTAGTVQLVHEVLAEDERVVVGEVDHDTDRRGRDHSGAGIDRFPGADRALACRGRTESAARGV